MIHDDPANDDFTVGNGDFRYVKAVKHGYIGYSYSWVYNLTCNYIQYTHFVIKAVKLQMAILDIVTFPSWDVRPKFRWGVQLSLGMAEIFFGLCLGFGW